VFVSLRVAVKGDHDSRKLGTREPLDMKLFAGLGDNRAFLASSATAGFTSPLIRSDAPSFPYFEIPSQAPWVLRSSPARMWESGSCQNFAAAVRMECLSSRFMARINL